MASNSSQLHIFFLPYMAPGHMIPIMEMARLFASRGVKSTIITTPSNKPRLSDTITSYNQQLDLKINILTLKFSSQEVGLPEGHESVDTLTSPDMFPKFCKALALLQHPFEDLMQEHKPDCLVADFFFTWANDTGTKFGVPRLLFSGSGYFPQCVIFSLLEHEPHKRVSSETEEFSVPGGLPHEIKLTRLQLSPYEKREEKNFLTEIMDQVRQSERSCYGVIMNSFYELESVYIDYYEKVLGIRNWHVGPVSLYFEETEKGVTNSSSQRGKKSSINVDECMRWLDGKESNSVIYICFGSMSHVADAQLREIALALETLGQNFIFVVRGEDTKEWVPQGFEERVCGGEGGQGLVIRGWAPQGLILEHGAVGGFVTHCGWNSILEGVINGLPMLTWPLHAEQFYNEKLVTDVLRVGVRAGSKKWMRRMGDEGILVGKDEVMKAIERLMGGEEAQEMRHKVKELKENARKAVSEGGSSWSDVNALIEDLKSCKNKKK